MNNKTLVFAISVFFFVFLILPIWSDGQGGNMSILERLLRLEKLIPPLGSILAWHKNMPANHPLPDGWVECNGQTLNDTQSPFHGQVIPNLNGLGGRGYFLRGGTSSGAMQSESVNPAGLTVDIAHTHSASHVSGNIHSAGRHEHCIPTCDKSKTGTATLSCGLDFASVPSYQENHFGLWTNAKGDHSHSFSLTAAGQILSTTPKNISGGGDETRPINMKVVWIMRIK